MRTDKGKAFVLRREGKSYREIASELGVAKSTLTNWFKGVDFSEAIKAELLKSARKKGSLQLQTLNRSRGVALEAKYELAREQALKELKLFRNIPLFVTGIAVYWGEGYKQGKNQLRLTNTDPRMLHLFVKFLEQFCGLNADDVRLAIFIYTDLDESRCKRYWAKHTGIKKHHKVQILPSKHTKQKCKYGIATIVVTNSYVTKKMHVWIDHLPEMVLNTVPKKKRGLG